MNQLSPELEAKAQELAARIHTRSADAILNMARQLVSVSDENLFGNTEFALRDQALKLVAHAYTEHLEKNEVTLPLASTAPTAPIPRPSTTTAKKRSKRLGEPSPATEPTTIVDPVEKDSAPGMSESD